jgi:hypothetical protein
MLKRVVALALCLTVVGLCVSTLSAAPVKQGKINLKLIFEKPWNLLVSIFPTLGNPSQTQGQDQGQPTDSGTKVIKPTEQGEAVIKLSGRD